MLVHCVELCLVCLVFLLLLVLRNFLKAMVLNLFDYSVNRHDEIEKEDQEDDDLKKDGVDVERSWHGDGRRESGNIG